MSRADFTRAAFRSILASSRGAATPRFAGPGDAWDRPPHEADLWISTDDAWDYAKWVDGKAKKLDEEVGQIFAAAVGHPNQQAADFPSAMANGRWRPWLADWTVYHDKLRDSTWERVNSWDKTREWHRQLLELQNEWAAVGGMLDYEVSPIPSLPYEAPERAGDGFNKAVDKLGSNLSSVAIIAAVVGGIYLLRKAT